MRSKYASQNHKKFLEKFVDFFEKLRIINIRMDTKNHIGSIGPEPLALLRGSKVVVGVKQLKKALSSGSARRVYLAENADPALTEPLETMCLEQHIPFVWIPAMSDLGRACGIDVGAAAAAVID